VVGRGCLDIEGILRHKGVGGCNGGRHPNCRVLSIFDQKFEEVGLGWQTVVLSNEDGAKSTNGCEFDVGTSL